MNKADFSDPVISAQGLEKTYQQGKLQVPVLRGVDFTVGREESHAIVGVSGAGKSTLMHLLGGLDSLSGGQIQVCGQDLSGLSESKLGRLRNRYLGFIYQFHHLLPEFSARDNIAMPLLIRRQPRSQAGEIADRWLERVGLQLRAEHKPGELSGGERQRVALARALVTEPACLLADEPTGNLDSQTAAQMLDLMLELNQHTGTSLVIVTHDMDIAAKMQFRWRMQDGQLAADQPAVTGL